MHNMSYILENKEEYTSYNQQIKADNYEQE